MFFTKSLNSETKIKYEDDLGYEYDTETKSLVLLRGYVYKAIFKGRETLSEEIIDLTEKGGTINVPT